MNLFKKILCLALSLLIVSLSCIFVSASTSENYYSNSLRAEKELESLKANTKLLNYFYELAPDEDYDGKYFPDYYGGSYIRDDGSLVIMLKDE